MMSVLRPEIQEALTRPPYKVPASATVTTVGPSCIHAGRNADSDAGGGEAHSEGVVLGEAGSL